MPPELDPRPSGLPTLQAARYLTPLKEGGSLPAVCDTAEDGLYVVKFRGAGQGAKALLAELVVGQLASALGLRVPDLALVELDEQFGATERDPEIRDILSGSVGVNVGLRYLEGAFNFDPVADPVDPATAAHIVWLDALTTNLDRSARNTNLLTWRGDLWLIDHGSALYFHHDWSSVGADRARDPFTLIESHVLLTAAGDLLEADRELAPRLDADTLEAVVAALPEGLLMDAPSGVEPPFSNAEENRRAYLDYLTTRLTPPRAFLGEARRAQERRRSQPAERKGYRR